MIIRDGPRWASVALDELSAAYAASSVLREFVDVPAAGSGGRRARAVVEILKQGGGLAPRALLGGEFVPANDDGLIIEVTVLTDLTASVPSCRSQLWRPLMAGLPPEFAQSVIDGIVRRPLPSGRLVVDRAGHDPVESSPLAFELAAELLSAVLAGLAQSEEIEEIVRQDIIRWS